MLSFFPVYKALNDLLFKGSILIKKNEQGLRVYPAVNECCDGATLINAAKQRV